ncbi:methyl-accepting chemotaxis protein [Azotosporobacter soli]|uniref:methyl-accepting chemotaxis protein n=1 Tax=Azotosporobacter soli TaxID=3055040 RepID=UPI0031FED033
MGSNSLKSRLVLLFILFALIPAAIGGAISAYLNLSSTKEASVRSNGNVAEQVAAHVELMVDDSRGLVEGLAASSTAKAMDAAALKETVLAIQKANPQFELIYVMDVTGMQIAKTSGALGPRGDRPYFKEAAKGSTFITDAYISTATNAPTVTVASPIKNASGAVIGVFAADISLKSFAELTGSIKIGQKGYVEIVDNKSILLAYPDSERVMKRDSIDKLDYARKLTEGKSGWSEGDSSRGDKTLASYAAIKSLGWGVIAHEPSSEITAAALASVKALAIVLLLCSILAIITALYIAKGIAEPMQKVVGVVEKIAAGDLAVDLKARGVQEVNQLVDGINHMTQSLRDIIRHTTGVSESVAAASEELAASAAEVGKASEEVAQTIQHVATGANDQVNLSERSSRVMQEMLTSISDTVSAAGRVAAVSKQSEQAAESGISRIEQAVNLMQAIHSDVDSTAKMIHALGEKSRQIGQIVEVITNIAGQTNLLALNAAIEAARAGEQGRGFAVVADEVRKLAEQSEEAAKEIAQIIGAIQSETVQSVNAMDRGNKQVAQGVEVVASSGEAFNEIYQAIKQMGSEVQAIVGLMERQQHSSAEVERSFGGIADSARLNAASSQEVAAASEEQSAAVHDIVQAVDNVAQMAESMQVSVNRFKL